VNSDARLLLEVRSAGQENNMPGKQAQMLTPRILNRMLAHVRGSPTPNRDRVIVLLSAKAGLRACEIARLDWSMVLDARGEVGSVLTIEDRIAKKRGGRRIPLHPELRRALRRLAGETGAVGPVILSQRDTHMRPNSIVNWFVTLFKALGIEGCSSHSGRRTFITGAARHLGRTGGSLRDIQLLAGHKSIETTQGYIEGDTRSQRKLIALI
jgi:integrase/recombinase XerD